MRRISFIALLLLVIAGQTMAVIKTPNSKELQKYYVGSDSSDDFLSSGYNSLKTTASSVFDQVVETSSDLTFAFLTYCSQGLGAVKDHMVSWYVGSQDLAVVELSEEPDLLSQISTAITDYGIEAVNVLNEYLTFCKEPPIKPRSIAGPKKDIVLDPSLLDEAIGFFQTLTQKVMRAFNIVESKIKGAEDPLVEEEEQRKKKVKEMPCRSRLQILTSYLGLKLRHVQRSVATASRSLICIFKSQFITPTERLVCQDPIMGEEEIRRPRFRFAIPEKPKVTGEEENGILATLLQVRALFKHFYHSVIDWRWWFIRQGGVPGVTIVSRNCTPGTNTLMSTDPGWIEFTTSDSRSNEIIAMLSHNILKRKDGAQLEQAGIVIKDFIITAITQTIAAHSKDGNGKEEVLALLRALLEKLKSSTINFDLRPLILRILDDEPDESLCYDISISSSL